jgi:hypothetical protein
MSREYLQVSFSLNSFIWNKDKIKLSKKKYKVESLKVKRLKALSYFILRTQ